MSTYKAILLATTAFIRPPVRKPKSTSSARHV